jgi:hypothetical protein
MQQTVLSQLLQAKLERPLEDQIAEAREAGADWRSIATALSAITGMTVSHETVRTWMVDEYPIGTGAAERQGAQ